MGSKYTSAAVSISCIVIKKGKDKPYLYQSVQRCFSEYPYVKHIPDSLQLSQKQTNLKIHSLTKNLVRLNTFTTYFPPKPIFFTIHMSFLIRTFSPSQKKVILAFIKRIAEHFYHKCSIGY